MELAESEGNSPPPELEPPSKGAKVTRLGSVPPGNLVFPTACSIACQGAGSSSGGELRQRSSGPMLSRASGWKTLGGGIKDDGVCSEGGGMEDDDVGPEGAPGAPWASRFTVYRRRALTNQYEIWRMLRPVCSLSASFSSSVG